MRCLDEMCSLCDVEEMRGLYEVCGGDGRLVLGTIMLEMCDLYEVRDSELVMRGLNEVFG